RPVDRPELDEQRAEDQQEQPDGADDDRGQLLADEVAHDPFDHDAHDGAADDQGDRHGERPRPAAHDVELVVEVGTGGGDRAVGEVEHPRGAVGEGQAEGRQTVEGAGREADHQEGHVLGHGAHTPQAARPAPVCDSTVDGVTRFPAVSGQSGRWYHRIESVATGRRRSPASTAKPRASVEPRRGAVPSTTPPIRRTTARRPASSHNPLAAATSTAPATPRVIQFVWADERPLPLAPYQLASTVRTPITSAQATPTTCCRPHGSAGSGSSTTITGPPAGPGRGG